MEKRIHAVVAENTKNKNTFQRYSRIYKEKNPTKLRNENHINFCIIQKDQLLNLRFKKKNRKKSDVGEKCWLSI